MTLTINSEKRASHGKNAARRIRREGRLPAVLYGSKIDSVALTLEKKDVFSILKSETGENTIFKVAFDEELRDVMIKDIQQDVVSDEVLHVDLIQIALDKIIRVMVPIVLTGEPVGVKAEGGFVDFVTREVEVDCLPKDIPDNIQLDISELHLNQSVKVEEIPEMKGISFASDPLTVIALVQTQAAEEVLEEEEEEDLDLAAEEAEPEVIGKDKADSEKASDSTKE